MRILSIAALVVLTSMVAHAQFGQRRGDDPRHDFIQRREAMERERERDRERERTSCALPDGTRHPLTTVVTHEGQFYRCMEVFTPNIPGPLENQTLTVRIAGWIKVQVP